MWMAASSPEIANPIKKGPSGPFFAAWNLLPVLQRLLGGRIHWLSEQASRRKVDAVHRLIGKRQVRYPACLWVEDKQIMLTQPQPAPKIDAIRAVRQLDTGMLRQALLFDGKKTPRELFQTITWLQTNQLGQPLPLQKSRIQLPEVTLHGQRALTTSLQHADAIQRAVSLKAQRSQRLTFRNCCVATQIVGQQTNQRRQGEKCQAAGATQPAENPVTFERYARRNKRRQYP